MTWKIIFTTIDGRDLATQDYGDIPHPDDVIELENITGTGTGGRYTITEIIRVYSETGAHTSTARALAGGPYDVVPGRAWIRLSPAH